MVAGVARSPWGAGGEEVVHCFDDDSEVGDRWGWWEEKWLLGMRGQVSQLPNSRPRLHVSAGEDFEPA